MHLTEGLLRQNFPNLNVSTMAQGVVGGKGPQGLYSGLFISYIEGPSEFDTLESDLIPTRKVSALNIVIKSFVIIQSNIYS